MGHNANLSTLGGPRPAGPPASAAYAGIQILNFFQNIVTIYLSLLIQGINIQCNSSSNMQQIHVYYILSIYTCNYVTFYHNFFGGLHMHTARLAHLHKYLLIHKSRTCKLQTYWKYFQSTANGVGKFAGVCGRLVRHGRPWGGTCGLLALIKLS